MREFEQRKLIRKTIYSRVSAVLLAIVLVFLLHETYQIYKKTRESRRQLELVNNKLEELDEKKERLADKISDLESPVGQEEEARSRFSLAKEDEKAIMIIDKEEPAPPAEETSFIESIWDKILSWITF
ncbi:MAG TPA: septum formation initiator family protein [Candidatus Paceibacterota bacterium]|nr:septum formation initiator family protein [Candidatus Paceibacterota bacterium]HRZ34622.1 septum formation initiator family protein [Candidatus Paceibacterota bacterium]